METETKTRQASVSLESHLRTDAGPQGRMDHTIAGWGFDPIQLSTEQLQCIVQQAWDQHGICADPFATETDWLDGVGDMLDPGPRVVEQLHGHVLHRTVDFTDAAHNTGERA